MAVNDADSAALEAQLALLDGSMAGFQGVTVAFQKEIEGLGGSLKTAGRDASGMSKLVATSFRKVFDGLVFDGKRMTEALATIGQGISSKVLNQALSPVQDALGSAVGTGMQTILGGLFLTKGLGTLGSKQVAAFAQGGVVGGPTRFPMQGASGVMGEAGPEAILPLARGSDGKLGVRSGDRGTSTVHVTMNVSTPDVAGFQRAQSQIAAEMSRAMQRGRRNL